MNFSVAAPSILSTRNLAKKGRDEGCLIPDHLSHIVDNIFRKCVDEGKVSISSRDDIVAQDNVAGVFVDFFIHTFFAFVHVNVVQ